MVEEKSRSRSLAENSDFKRSSSQRAEHENRFTLRCPRPSRRQRALEALRAAALGREIRTVDAAHRRPSLDNPGAICRAGVFAS